MILNDVKYRGCIVDVQIEIPMISCSLHSDEMCLSVGGPVCGGFTDEFLEYRKGGTNL